MKGGCGFLQRFGNIEEFKQYVEHVGDKEWAAKLAILQWGGSRTEEYINTIYRLNVNDMSQAGNFDATDAYFCVSLLIFNF